MAAKGATVMILTAGFEGEPKPSAMHGLVLSSVTSLAVEPEPMLLFNIRLPSKTAEQIHRYSYFALHMLRPTEKSIHLAKAFSQGIKAAATTTRPFDQLDRLDWGLYNASESIRLPILMRESERIMICEKYKVFPMECHEVWTCKVKAVLRNEDKQPDSGGLLYFNRGFHRMGDPL